MVLDTPPTVEVIIPLGPQSMIPRSLIDDLVASSIPIIVSATRPPDTDLPKGVRWISGPTGRGHQLNLGIESSEAAWLWMIHADSVIPRESATEVIHFSQKANWQQLGYCQLAFDTDGPWVVKLNEWGANLRSRYLSQPYGDQALCMHRELWHRLSGFKTDLDRGEDLDFVIRAQRFGARTEVLPITITTSASRYRKEGWLKTTLHHQIQAWRLIRNARRWQP